MTTLTVDIPESEKDRIERYIRRIGKVVSESKPAGKLPIEELEEGLAQIKAIRQGKLPKSSLKEALRG